MLEKLKAGIIAYLGTQGIIIDPDDIILMSYQHMKFLKETFLYLESLGLLTDKNCRQILDQQIFFKDFYSCFFTLRQVMLINQKNLDILFQTETLASLSKLLQHLFLTTLLTHETWEFICRHPELNEFSKDCEILYKAELLNLELLKLIYDHPERRFLIFALHALKISGCLTPVVHAQIVSQPFIRQLCMAIDNLYCNHLLNKDNLNLLFLHKFPEQTAMALQYLHAEGLLTPLNRERLKKHPHPNKMARIIEILFEAESLNQKFFAFFASLENIALACEQLSRFHSQGKLKLTVLEELLVLWAPPAPPSPAIEALGLFNQMRIRDETQKEHDKQFGLIILP